MGFEGYVQLGDTFRGVVLMRDAQRAAPADQDDPPTFRVYGPDGLVPGAVGAAALLDTGTISGATNGDPIVVTSAGHGLTTGTHVTVSGVQGNAAANGGFRVTRLTSSTFALDGSVGGGAYASGGEWHLTGLYRYEVEAAAAAGFDVGRSYSVFLEGEVQGEATAEMQTFVVT